MPSHIRRHRSTPQRGFTLIEVLIALVVLSIGLLGVAKLVMGAVHADDSAYMRSQATQLAYELLDTMRANRPGAVADYYSTQAPSNSNTCLAGSCNDQVLAALDLNNWLSEVAAALPGGAGTVTMATDPYNDTVATITVYWNDSMAQWTFGTASNATPSGAALCGDNMPAGTTMCLTLESVL